MTNVTRGHLQDGAPLDTVKYLLNLCLKENTLVAVELQEDLKSLRYNCASETMDLQDYYRDDTPQQQKISLRSLAIRLLNKSEDFQSGAHSAIQDARNTAQLYKWMQNNKTPGETFCQTYQRLHEKPFQRTSKPRFYPDPCRCRRPYQSPLDSNYKRKLFQIVRAPFQSEMESGKVKYKIPNSRTNKSEKHNDRRPYKFPKNSVEPLKEDISDQPLDLTTKTYK